MRRIILIAALAGALLVPATAVAWDDVTVFVAFPQRATSGQVSTMDFHVMLGGKPLDLATVGRRVGSLEPTVVFVRGRDRVIATAHRTARPGVYRVRVLLPAGGAWSYSFRYDGLVRTFPRIKAR